MNKKNNILLNEIRDKLKKAGLKITPQRIEIYQAVIKCGHHPSADTVFKIIHKDNPGISFDTVNRTLLNFADCGIFNIVEGYNSARYYDHIIDEHHHYRCSNCNVIFDCFYKPYNKLGTPDDIPDNFLIKRKRVVIEGLCSDCAKKKNKKNE